MRSSKTYSDDQIQIVINLYKSGKSLKEIENEVYIPATSCKRILLKNNIELRKSGTIPINKELVQQFIELYKSGINSEKIAKKFNVDASTVCRALKKNNVDILPGDINKRKYHINENFFETIDNELKAYILCLMYSDGNVSSRQYSFKLAMKDKDVIEIFCQAFYGNKDHITGDPGDMWRSEVYSKTATKHLIKCGCVADKSHIITYPNLRNDLHKHFIRGYLDGDGCLSISSKNRCKVNFTSSSKQMIIGLGNILKSFGFDYNIYTNNRKNKNPIHFIEIGKNSEIKKFILWLYDGANFYMKRKYNKHLDLLNLLNSKS